MPDTSRASDMGEYQDSGSSGTSKRESSKGSSMRIKSKGSSKGRLKKSKSMDSSSSQEASGSRAESEIEMLTPKQNGTVEAEQPEDTKTQSATIKNMWKKAFKSLKSNEKQTWLSKKSSVKRKDSKEQDEIEPTPSHEIDPVYSLLKCAADLPKAGKTCSHSGSCSGHHARHSLGDSSGSTSKASSPSSSASHSPRTRRKKLNSRMKSFSLDTPDPPKQLLGIDESTKKKSSSFTNTCFGAPTSPEENHLNVPVSSTARKKFGFTHRSNSLEIEDKKTRSHSLSPLTSPVCDASEDKASRQTDKEKSKKKDMDVYVVLYNFRAKEKDDLDLRAGWKVSVSNSSDPDWWKGKHNGKAGYFPATYVLRLQPGQRVFQVSQPFTLPALDGDMLRFHKDQVLLLVGKEEGGIVHIRAPNLREAMVPLHFLQEI